MEPGKTFQNLSREKQERITRIAVEEFGAKGFEGASINRMVERMDIAKGSIFQYFGDKNGLFLFVFNQSVEMVKTYLRGVRDQSTDQPLKVRLQNVLEAGIRFIDDHPLLFRLYTRVLFDPKVPFRDEILISLRKQSVLYLKSLLETTRTKGELNDAVDPDKAAFVMDAVLDRFLQAHAIRHLDFDLGIYGASIEKTREWTSEIIDILCTGVVRPSESGDILIVGAVEEELKKICHTIENPLASMIGHRKVTSGILNDNPVRLLVTGPGMVNTAQALTAAIEAHRPCLIIQTGCAGAFPQSGIHIGDVAVATEETDIHTGLESVSTTGEVDELPFSLLKTGTREFKNRFPVNAGLVDLAFEILQSGIQESDFQIHKGPFITVSTITATNRRAATLFETFNPCMEQMEGAAAAQIATLYDIPFLEIRAASNFVGDRDRAAWELDRAFVNSKYSVLKLIQNINISLINDYFIKK